jgi:hypothetical protein
MNNDRIQKIVDEATKEIGDRVATYHKRLYVARTILDKIERLLPEGWDVTYEPISGSLTFKKNDKSVEEEPVEDDRTLSLEFREVCRHIDRVIKPKKLQRTSDISWNTEKVQLNGYAWLCGDVYNGLTINVHLGNPNCQVEYKEEYVEAQPARTRRVAIVPDHCLGK